MSSQTHLYGVCARAALLFAAFVAVSTILACSSVYLAAASPSSTPAQHKQDASAQVRRSIFSRVLNYWPWGCIIMMEMSHEIGLFVASVP